ncbi:MAG TPA: efflux RND transporter periplasmic adaptor subunit [Xanthomonadales bacterium]|nr:efflux RND transporter periplasmic adaptor subunit [Xanthomonadales bacterium]
MSVNNLNVFQLLPAVVLASLAWAFAAAPVYGQGTPVQVLVSNVENQSFPLSAQALGTARANEAIDVRAEITAAITAIRFEEGQWVEKGEVLVELENASQLAAVASARAALIESTSQLKRSEELFRTNVVAASQLEQLKAKQQADQANVHAAESRMVQTVIRAPFAGRLGLRRVSVGSIVDSNTVITTLDDTSRIKLDFEVPEVFLARLEPGLAVKAQSAAYPEQSFTGEVASVDTRVDPVSRTISVRAIMPNEDGHLRPGMFLTVSLLREDVEALVVPEAAIVPERSKQFVYVVDPQNVVSIREVQTGRRRPGEVEILGGLVAGEQVITEGTQKVRAGQIVAPSLQSVAGQG